MHPRQRLSLRSLALRLFGLLLPAMLAVAPALEAQQTGTVTGRVTDSQSGEPVGSVQIFIEGLDIGALTQQNGRYLLQNVPAGTHTLSAERIGYRVQTTEVTVGAGETVVQNFQVSEEALQLDEVIVTGTPGGTQRRAIGNAVTRLEAADVVASRPIESMQQMLQGRSTGLDFTRAPGMVGVGSQIRIRGVSSIQLGTQPLIYVDGVRMDNATNLGPGLPNVSGQSGSSALDDLNPNEIESIEIIKGPAAATLYGTEASAGVIQIITKRGETGAPTFDVSMTQGTNFLIDPAGMIGDLYGCETGFPLFTSTPCTEEQLFTYNPFETEKEAGYGSPVDYGHNQEYTVGLRGGTEAINYYLSANYLDQKGIVDYNWSDRINTRANVGVLISESLDLDVSLGYVRGETSYANGTVTVGGLWPNLMWLQGFLLDTPQRGFLQQTPEEFALVDSRRDYSRFTGSATLSHNPTDWLTHRLIIGIDRGEEESYNLYPRSPEGANGPFRGRSLGDITLERPLNSVITLDYSASGTFDVTDALTLTSSVGAQYYSSEFNRIETRGQIFASPAIRSVEGATVRDAGQTFRQNKSMGVFFQQEAGWNDRIFLTAAVRGDDNSAFGSDFDAAIYPKFSGTWVVSEEEFWNVGWLNSFRLRTAWGQSGRQPETFDAVTLFAPAIGPGGSAAVRPSTLGNPDIGPEVSSELEVGFDAAFLDDRISSEFTYYYQQTKDALTSLPLSPTNGFPGNQAANVGQLDTWGYEVALQARAIDGGDFSLDLGANLSYTMNELKDLGGRQPTSDFREGFPYPARASDIIVSAELDQFGQPTNLMCDAGTADMRIGGPTVPCSEIDNEYELLLGPTFSPWTWSVDATVTLFQDLQLYGMVDGEAGAWYNDFNLSCRHTYCGFTNARKALLRDDPIYVASVWDWNQFPTDERYQFNLPNDYIKLRELGLRYNLPESLVGRAGADRASVSLSARELWYLWRKDDDLAGVHSPSPEVADPASTTQFALFQWPPLTSLQATVRVTF